jgi:hypothetical protein
MTLERMLIALVYSPYIQTDEWEIASNYQIYLCMSWDKSLTAWSSQQTCSVDTRQIVYDAGDQWRC